MPQSEVYVFRGEKSKFPSLNNWPPAKLGDLEEKSIKRLERFRTESERTVCEEGRQGQDPFRLTSTRTRFCMPLLSFWECLYTTNRIDFGIGSRIGNPIPAGIDFQIDLATKNLQKSLFVLKSTESQIWFWVYFFSERQFCAVRSGFRNAWVLVIRLEVITMIISNLGPTKFLKN